MKKLILLSVSILLLVSSCRKKESGCTDPNGLNYNSSAEENDGSCSYYAASSSDAAFKATPPVMAGVTEDLMIYTFASSSAENGKTDNKMPDTLATPSCAVLTLNSSGPNQWPKTLTIDFGTSGCVCFDGKSRKGQIIAQFTSLWKLHNKSDSIIITFNNYSVNDTGFTGTRYFWVDTFNLPSGKMGIGMKVENASIVYPDQSKAYWSGTGTYNIEGLNTPANYTDDKVYTGFTGNGTTVGGKSFTVSTATPLLSLLNCMNTCPFVEGKAMVSTSGQKTVQIPNTNSTITVNVKADVTLDFGSGVCDGIFNVTTHTVVTKTTGELLSDDTYGPEQKNCSDLYKLQQ